MTPVDKNSVTTVRTQVFSTCSDRRYRILASIIFIVLSNVCYCRVWSRHLYFVLIYLFLLFLTACVCYLYCAIRCLFLCRFWSLDSIIFIVLTDVCFWSLESIIFIVLSDICFCRFWSLVSITFIVLSGVCFCCIWTLVSVIVTVYLCIC